ncbi:uncharacterized protein OCT59_023605 [Rhizophagus irregularis]|uniref:Skt5p n=1 Tax=Rhizophagus irregularis (strain DAOM 197198w) TaxID=1432141 RepID=A0A015N0W6_RHIIW|nr:Skt5p [Rhizophagus irregularis DAOM 197198w]UZO03196.1 hypothetical protein OCT59_023605 [Rhizophagus irregularis]GBC20577.1 kinase-like domain-containing protein [Rhizophagus irregularis DAOM 181602=DAOM 197198]
MFDNQINNNLLNINNLSNEYSQIIQNFNKIDSTKEIEPTIKNINKNIFDGNLNMIIDELIDMIFKKLNEGVYKEVIKKHVINFIINQGIISQEIYNYLLNNQNESSNSIYLLGYFNYNGIETNINMQKAFELYQKAMEMNNNNCVAQLDLTEIYIHGNGIKTNHNKAFELSNKLAEKGIPNAINKLGYCYEKGIGTYADWQKAFEFYQKAAELGNSTGINNTGYCHYNGIGTDVNKQKGFELYQKGANLNNYIAQYNLASMYENGNGIIKDIDQAIYWYKKSAEQGYNYAQSKFNLLSGK